jgi:2-polyprenyl-3-methyl-5-hydroxy-6-metoxy-1,4-benzoquinol methylase
MACRPSSKRKQPTAASAFVVSVTALPYSPVPPPASTATDRCHLPVAIFPGGAQQRLGADTADMSDCCDPRGCNELFGPRFARHLTSRYRKRGLDKTAARMAAYVVDRGVDGASVLEIGGGVGALQLELLAKGASRTTNLELVDAYDADASELAESAGMRDRMIRRQVDIAATPHQVEAHDIVVLHRVVCCYPDYERLLTAAADHAKRLLVFSHPPRNLVSRTAARLENATFRLRGKAFRTFAHPPAAMVAVAEERGMRTDYTYRGRVWQVVGLARTATAN